MELGSEKKLKSESVETESKKKSKGLNIEGYQVEGLSIGGHETCVIFPYFKVAFDIGRCPPRAVSMDFLLISHAHMDHIVSFLVTLFVSLLMLANLFIIFAIGGLFA